MSSTVFAPNSIQRGGQDTQSEARRVLRTSPYRSIRCIKVTATPDLRLELDGIVPSYYLKQMAQELLRRMATESGYQIDSRLTVTDPSQQPSEEPLDDHATRSDLI